MGELGFPPTTPLLAPLPPQKTTTISLASHAPSLRSLRPARFARTYRPLGQLVHAVPAWPAPEYLPPGHTVQSEASSWSVRAVPAMYVPAGQFVQLPLS